MNADGHLDVLALEGNFLTASLGDGTGALRPGAGSHDLGAAAMAFAVGDFNGDGRLDAAVATSEGNLHSSSATAPAPSPSRSLRSLAGR